MRTFNQGIHISVNNSGQYMDMLEKISTIKKCSTCRRFYDSIEKYSEIVRSAVVRRRLENLKKHTEVTHECLGCVICHSEQFCNAVGLAIGRAADSSVCEIDITNKRRNCMAKILDGKKLADSIKLDVRRGVGILKKRGVDVGLALMIVGNNPASLQYYKTTLGTCKRVGISAYEYRLTENTSLNEILNIINSINNDERIHGLLILMPLPIHINSRRVINSIMPEKDVDGLGAISVGRLAADESSFQLFLDRGRGASKHLKTMPSMTSFLPCTPFGVIRLLESYNVQIKGKHVVVIGKSLAVGKPLANMFLAKEATVTVCHKATGDLSVFTRQADILCSATGRAGLITGNMVKQGVIAVDIGINMVKDGTITGDIDFESVSKKASMITPVPGGVGPVTIAMLMENTLRSAQRNELMMTPLIVA